MAADRRGGANSDEGGEERTAEGSGIGADGDEFSAGGTTQARRLSYEREQTTK